MVNFNPELMSELADAFYTLSGMRMGLLDIDACEFFAYPAERSVFCSIVRANPKINRDCINCDLKNMQKCRKSKSALVYTCHLGLTEVMVPIIENDNIICYFMFGQVIIDEFREQSRNHIYSCVEKEGFEEKEINVAIENIQSVSSKKLHASVKILDTILSYIFSKKLVTHTKTRFINRINSYIDSHLGDPIHVSDLYRYFNISRTTLYELSRLYLNCGISDYITKRKFYHIQKMLEETNLKISDLVGRIGFSDYNYFSKVFKRKTGLSPREYRNQVKVIDISRLK